jgi:hypothetical protein
LNKIFRFAKGIYSCMVIEHSKTACTLPGYILEHMGATPRKAKYAMLPSKKVN